MQIRKKIKTLLWEIIKILSIIFIPLTFENLSKLFWRKDRVRFFSSGAGCRVVAIFIDYSSYFFKLEYMYHKIFG